MFARDTYWDNLDLRFSLSPSPVTNSTLPSQLSTTEKKFIDVFNVRYFHVHSPFNMETIILSIPCVRDNYNADKFQKQLFIFHEFFIYYRAYPAILSNK